MRRSAPAALALFIAATGPAAATAQPKLVVKEGAWSVYSREVDGDRVCYALAEPQDSAPRNVDHGKVAFMIATWRSGAAADQPSFHAGYELRASAQTLARVGSDRFPMYAVDNEAFIEETSQERRLVNAMKRGSTMRVETVSSRGTATAYEFSLSGATAAMQAAAKACGR